MTTLLRLKHCCCKKDETKTITEAHKTSDAVIKLCVLRKNFEATKADNSKKTSSTVPEHFRYFHSIPNNLDNLKPHMFDLKVAVVGDDDDDCGGDGAFQD